MLLIYLLFLSITLVTSFNPSCKSCVHFISNNIKEDLGLCNLFQDAVYHNNIKTLQKNLAIHCRGEENLCGKSGFAYEKINSDTKKVENYEYINKLYVDDLIQESSLEELEQIEKELVDVFQKMRRHNLRTFYNIPKTFSKLLKNKRLF